MKSIKKVKRTNVVLLGVSLALLTVMALDQDYFNKRGVPSPEVTITDKGEDCFDFECINEKSLNILIERAKRHAKRRA